MRKFFTFFFMQATAYLVLVTNLRAISALQYEWAAVTEMVYLILQWEILRRVISSNAWTERAGYILGGAVGTLTSMWLTRVWG